MSRYKRAKERRVHMRRLNWDAMFYSDLLKGNSFIISEPAEVSMDGTKQKSLYGPQSPLYGTSYEDDQSFIERYRCTCGEFKGRHFEGEICPICGDPVEEKGSDVNVTGWISLGMDKIINPYYFNLLSNTIGNTRNTKIFSDIVYAKYKVTTDGKRELPTIEDLDSEPSSPYAGIGIDAFYDNFENILTYFASQSKKKKDALESLINQKRKVFTSHIPIPSTMLRPQSITSDTYYFSSADKHINTACSLAEQLKDAREIEKDLILQRLQKRVNSLWDLYFSELHGKFGLIHGELLGGDLNYTARNVICPDPSLHDNEIDLSYNTFLEVFKYKIIYYIMRLEDIPLSKAYAKWKNATKFDQSVYDIMMYIIKRADSRVLINRNPTLNFYSMLLMKIRRIIPSGTVYTLSVPLSILPGLNADSTISTGSEYMVTCIEKHCERLTSGVIYNMANGKSYIRHFARIHSLRELKVQKWIA